MNMGQIFFYHPKFGAQGVDTTGCHKVDTTQFSPKSVDNPPSLVQNTRMCATNVRFVTAVALAVEALRSAPFSAHNVTTWLRTQVNAGDLSLIDKAKEDVDGADTYFINHDEVRNTLRELVENKVITDLTARDTGRYIEYSNAGRCNAVAGAVTCAGQVVQPPFVQPPPVFVNAKPTALPPDAALRQKLQDYLKGRMSQNVTMKEIQSRFKGVNKTCKEWAELVANIGLTVNSYGPVSTWTTMM